MASEIYSQTPLADHEIRLIRFSEDGDGCVTCELGAFDLHEKYDLPSYAALSYRWGSSKRNRIIYYYGDQPLLITESLDIFVHEVLRCQDKAERWSYGWFWIDAVCINQDDVVERSQQVRMMKEIYEGSGRIVIWLGEAEDGTDEAFELLEQVSDLANRQGVRLRDGSMPGTTCIIGDEELFVEALYSTVTFDLPSILRSAYWDRTWIIQEASTPNYMTSHFISGCNTIVHCGSHTMPFSKLNDANKALIVAAYHNEVPHLAQLHGIVNEDIATLEYIQYQRRNTEYADSLYSLMIRSRTYAATDVRDKLYSVLALAEEKHEELLQPDYALGVEEVYTRLAKTLIITSNSLDCIGSAGLLRNTYVPSWVPDWTVQHSAIPQPFFAYDGYEPGSRRTDSGVENKIFRRRVFNADNGLPATIRFSRDDESLQVRGFIFDTISSVSLPRHHDPGAAEPELPTQQVWDNWIALAKPTHDAYLTGPDTRFQAFTNLLKTETTAVFTDWTALRQPATSTEPRPAQPRLLMAPPFEIEGFTDAGVNAFELNDGILNAMTWERKIFITPKGYLGLGASTVEEGDCVCVLYGSQMPVVLRRAGKREEQEGLWWELVGQAYVSGIMDGEAVKMTDGKMAEMEFEIR